MMDSSELVHQPLLSYTNKFIRVRKAARNIFFFNFSKGSCSNLAICMYACMYLFCFNRRFLPVAAHCGLWRPRIGRILFPESDMVGDFQTGRLHRIEDILPSERPGLYRNSTGNTSRPQDRLIHKRRAGSGWRVRLAPRDAGGRCAKRVPQFPLMWCFLSEAEDGVWLADIVPIGCDFWESKILI